MCIRNQTVFELTWDIILELQASVRPEILLQTCLVIIMSVIHIRRETVGVEAYSYSGIKGKLHDW